MIVVLVHVSLRHFYPCVRLFVCMGHARGLSHFSPWALLVSLCNNLYIHIAKMPPACLLSSDSNIHIPTTYITLKSPWSLEQASKQASKQAKAATTRKLFAPMLLLGFNEMLRPSARDCFPIAPITFDSLHQFFLLPPLYNTIALLLLFFIFKFILLKSYHMNNNIN